MSRVDGVAKVTGQAKYAAEFQVPNLAYGFIVHEHDRARARSRRSTRARPRRAPGVIRVFTHLNVPKLGPKPPAEQAKPRATQRSTTDRSARCSRDRILFNAQPIALVVAETFEQARYAARLVKATYDEEKHVTDPQTVLRAAPASRRRRDAAEAARQSGRRRCAARR